MALSCDRTVAWPYLTQGSGGEVRSVAQQADPAAPVALAVRRLPAGRGQSQARNLQVNGHHSMHLPDSPATTHLLFHKLPDELDVPVRRRAASLSSQRQHAIALQARTDPRNVTGSNAHFCSANRGAAPVEQAVFGDVIQLRAGDHVRDVLGPPAARLCQRGEAPARHTVSLKGHRSNGSPRVDLHQDVMCPHPA